MVQEAQSKCQPKWNTYPCGYYGDSKHNCRCTPLQIQNYRNKISGPLLDRIDIHIEVPSVRYHELASIGTGEPSADIRERGRKVRCNAGMRTKELHKHCQLKSDAQAQFPPSSHRFGLWRAGKMAITELNFSAPPSPRWLWRASRAYDRILKVARTIADLAASPDIQTEHVSEAIQYRNLDRQFWI